MPVFVCRRWIFSGRISFKNMTQALQIKLDINNEFFIR